MSTVKKELETVTLSWDGALYCIPCGSGMTTLGINVAYERATRYADWLKLEGQEIEPPDAGLVGDLQGYNDYLRVLNSLQEYCHRVNKKCPVDLEPQLIGLEGKRVEVETRQGEKRRFYVGKSSGFVPVHLEIKRHDSTGGEQVYGGPFKRVTVISF